MLLKQYLNNTKEIFTMLHNTLDYKAQTLIIQLIINTTQ